MSRTSVQRPRRIRRQARTATIRELETVVTGFEARYNCSTVDMIERTKSGRTRETAEIGKWLSKYQALEDLRGRNGRTTGTHTSTT